MKSIVKILLGLVCLSSCARQESMAALSTRVFEKAAIQRLGMKVD